MTLENSLSKKFNIKRLEDLKYDPVHPDSIHNPRRLGDDREIFFLLEEDTTTFVLCVAYTDVLPNTMDEILDTSHVAKNPKFAIFYSVFKTPHIRNTVHKGGWLILSAASYIKENYPTIEHFTTMSPIPSLSKKFDATVTEQQINDYIMTRKDPVSSFHLKNGADLIRIIPDADSTAIRISQSWGYMANYDYTSLINTL
jgi:hypothetical protein